MGMWVGPGGPYPHRATAGPVQAGSRAATLIDEGLGTVPASANGRGYARFLGATRSDGEDRPLGGSSRCQVDLLGHGQMGHAESLRSTAPP